MTNDEDVATTVIARLGRSDKPIKTADHHVLYSIDGKDISFARIDAGYVVTVLNGAGCCGELTIALPTDENAIEKTSNKIDHYLKTANVAVEPDLSTDTARSLNDIANKMISLFPETFKRALAEEGYNRFASDREELVISECSAGYVVSLVSGSRVLASTVLGSAVDNHKFAQETASFKARVEQARKADNSSGHGGGSNNDNIHTCGAPSIARHSADVHLRNAPHLSDSTLDNGSTFEQPPGFEDEHQLRHAGPLFPGFFAGIQPGRSNEPVFGDHDRGAFPTVPLPGGPAGMHPRPFGMNQRPGIRYDPVAPDDPMIDGEGFNSNMPNFFPGGNLGGPRFP